MSNEAEIIIESIKDIFEIATSGFDAFYHSADSNITGDSSKSASSGDCSTSASSGDSSTSASSGKHASTSALGYRAAVKGELGNLLMCSEFILEKGTAIPIGGKASLVDGKILKPNRWYIVEQGEWVEVDFTDNIFSYVLTTKKGVKKVRLENGTINFIVYDNEGNAAHGTSIEEARKDLIYKKTVKFDGKVPEHATGEEWVGLYRTITGSCIVGIKSFVESMQLDLSKVYSSKEVCEIIVGQYGSEQFIEKAKGDV